jgi:hypothetical protein
MSGKLVMRLLCVLVLAGSCSCKRSGQPEPPKPVGTTQPAATTQSAVATKPAATTKPAAAANDWEWLTDGKTMAGWKVPKFGGDGKVYVKDGDFHMEAGDMCTGITYADGNTLPREDYELELEAMRVEGDDFFAGLTFPVGKDHISLICDGWAGAVTGLSCLDDFDASLNETTQDLEFKNKQWYVIRVRVTKTHITCWVDDKQIINVARKGRKISIRPEVDLSLPLGVATWQTHGAVRNIRLRRLKDGGS